MTKREAVDATASFLAAPRFVTALTTTIVGVSVLAFALRQTVGLPGLIAILCVLALLASGSIAARRDAIEWRGLLPVSLLIFLAWAFTSFFWSQYHWATAAGLAYLAAFTLLGVYVALLRETIQIVRAFGDVLRFTIALSLALEVLAGVLIDSPIDLLQIQGNLAELGPIQGLSGTRNQLGIIALIALITFGTEFRTHTTTRWLSIGSISGASLALLLSRSPLDVGALLVVCIAAAALYGLRRVAPDRRGLWQIVLLAATVITGVLAWSFRSNLVSTFNAGGDLTYRLGVWRQTWELISIRPLQGWGWIGTWQEEIAPFQLFSATSARQETSASNAFLDVWFQLGLVGLVIFIGLVSLAFVRSWLLASYQRSIVFAWPALVLVAVLVTALGESSMLVEFGWLTFVVCAVKAAERLSWRQAFAKSEPTV